MGTASAKAVFDADSSKMEAAMDRIGGKLSHLDGAFKAFSGFGLLDIGKLLAAEKLAEHFHSTIEKGHSLEILHERTGAAIGDLFLLGKAFEKVGMSAEDVPLIIGKMQKALAHGSANGILDQLGLDPEKLRKQSAADSVRQIGNALWTIPGAADRAAASMEIFGSAAILPAFAHGRADEVFEKKREQGDVFERSAETFSRVHEKMASITGSLNTGWLQLEERLAQHLLPLLDRIQEVAKSIGGGLQTSAQYTDFILSAKDDPNRDMLGEIEKFLGTGIIQIVGMPFGAGDVDPFGQNADVQKWIAERDAREAAQVKNKKAHEGDEVADPLDFGGGGGGSAGVTALGRIGGNWGGGGGDPWLDEARTQTRLLETIASNTARAGTSKPMEIEGSDFATFGN